MFRFYESQSMVERYQKYRPRYPERIARITLGEVDKRSMGFMLDVGCGSGFSVDLFAPYFQRVLAIDPSVNQLKEAKRRNKFSHVTYQEGFAENLPVDDVSVNVIITGVALHWFDRPRFYKEAMRVLKPGGKLISFAHCTPKLVPVGISGDMEKMTEFGSNLLDHYTTLGHKVDSAHKAINQIERNRYSDIFKELPFEKKKRDDSCFVEFMYTLDGVQELLKSTDAYESFMESKVNELQHLSKDDREKKLAVLDYSKDFVKELKVGWGCTEMNNTDVHIKSVYNFSVIISEK